MATRDDQADLSGTGDAQIRTGRGAADAACGFCAILRGEEKATLIDESERLMSFLDHRPLFHGHVLLIPKIHVQLMSDLPADRVNEFFVEAQRLERAVEKGLEADGSMILINNVVSQSVPHLHLHVIPRRKKDGYVSGSARGIPTTRNTLPNSMPTRSGTHCPPYRSRC